MKVEEGWTAHGWLEYQTVHTDLLMGEEHAATRSLYNTYPTARKVQARSDSFMTSKSKSSSPNCHSHLFELEEMST